MSKLSNQRERFLALSPPMGKKKCSLFIPTSKSWEAFSSLESIKEATEMEVGSIKEATETEVALKRQI